MQMDKRNCDGSQDELKLSAEGIRFEPMPVQATEIDLSTVTIASPARLPVEELVTVTK